MSFTELQNHYKRLLKADDLEDAIDQAKEEGHADEDAHSRATEIMEAIKLIQNGELVFNVYKEHVSQITFQAWGNENVIRVYFSTESDVSDFLVYFNPKPRLKYAEF